MEKVFIFLIEFGDYIESPPLKKTKGTIFFPSLSELNFNRTGRRQGKSEYSFIRKIN